MPLKDLIKRKEYKQAYYIKHKEEILLKRKRYQKENKDFIKNRRMLRKVNYPWRKAWSAAKQRCTNPNDGKYYRYGARGIKFLLSKEDIKKLWFKHKAWLLKRASLDRKDNDGDYTFKNCQFIEFEENSVKDRKKPVLQFDLKGKFIREWESIVRAQKKLGVFHIGMVLAKQRKTAGGFIWKIKKG